LYNLDEPMAMSLNYRFKVVPVFWRERLVK